MHLIKTSIINEEEMKSEKVNRNIFIRYLVEGLKEAKVEIYRSILQQQLPYAEIVSFKIQRVVVGFYRKCIESFSNSWYVLSALETHINNGHDAW